MSTSIISSAKFKVSSVYAEDTTTFGKLNLADGSEETCWQSAQGIHQFIKVRFSQPEIIKTLKIQFQGGFSANQIHIKYKSTENEWSSGQIVYPEDTNEMQTFKLDSIPRSDEFSLDLESGSDFYGRFVVYHLDILA